MEQPFVQQQAEGSTADDTSWTEEALSADDAGSSRSASRIECNTHQRAGAQTLVRLSRTLSLHYARSRICHMDNPCCEPPDQTRIVALLSEESHVALDEVATLYERERAALAVGSHVPNFLHVFAMRNVREMLRSRPEQAACIPELRKDFWSNLEHALAG